MATVNQSIASGGSGFGKAERLHQFAQKDARVSRELPSRTAARDSDFHSVHASICEAKAAKVPAIWRYQSDQLHFRIQCGFDGRVLRLVS